MQFWPSVFGSHNSELELTAEAASSSLGCWCLPLLLTNPLFATRTARIQTPQLQRSVVRVVVSFALSRCWRLWLRSKCRSCSSPPFFFLEPPLPLPSSGEQIFSDTSQLLLHTATKMVKPSAHNYTTAQVPPILQTTMIWPCFFHTLWPEETKVPHQVLLEKQKSLEPQISLQYVSRRLSLYTANCSTPSFPLGTRVAKCHKFGSYLCKNIRWLG